MKRLLLLLGAAAMLVAAPAFAQSVFLDTAPFDGVCNSSDVLSDASTSVDVWIDTTPCDIFSYEFILSSNGNVTYGAFTNLMGTFTTPFGVASGGNDYHNGFGGTIPLVAGPYKVGSVAITVAPGTTPVISVAASSTLSASFFTAFGSQSCNGQDFDNTIKLGASVGPGMGDFTSACGTAAPTPIRSTTWGAIKNIYR
jgi:hypothetical protein